MDFMVLNCTLKNGWDDKSYMYFTTFKNIGIAGVPEWLNQLSVQFIKDIHIIEQQISRTFSSYQTGTL